MQWPKPFPQLAVGHDHFIIQNHLSKIVQPVSIEVVFSRDNLNALTQTRCSPSSSSQKMSMSLVEPGALASRSIYAPPIRRTRTGFLSPRFLVQPLVQQDNVLCLLLPSLTSELSVTEKIGFTIPHHGISFPLFGRAARFDSIFLIQDAVDSPEIASVSWSSKSLGYILTGEGKDHAKSPKDLFVGV